MLCFGNTEANLFCTLAAEEINKETVAYGSFFTIE